jgi:drug/metabolite transporter (DMT)-like permease
VLVGAFVPAFAKLTTGRADALFVATVTSVFGGAAALVLLGVRGQLGELARRSTAPRLVLVGALGTSAAYYLFFEGARRTSAIDAVLCLQIESAYALVLARIFLGHPITLRRLGAVLLLVGGIALAVGATGFESSFGVGLLLLTPLCWQVSHLVVLRGLRDVSPQVLTAARYVFGGALLVLVWLAGGGADALPERATLVALLPALALQGVVLSFVGTMLWYETITRLDLARSTAIVVPSIPLLSIGASFLLLGEVATARQWAGLALIAGGVLAFVTSPHPREARERIPTASAPIAVPTQGASRAEQIR